VYHRTTYITILLPPVAGDKILRNTLNAANYCYGSRFLMAELFEQAIMDLPEKAQTVKIIFCFFVLAFFNK
jgi:hypothetical protein